MTGIGVLPVWAVEPAGMIAATSTTLCFVPQLLRVWRRKSAGDISLVMFLLFSFGVFCWLVYGLAIGSLPVVAANALTLALSLAILALKLRYDARERREKARAAGELAGRI